MSEELYYLQDKRQYVGNDMLWWAKENKGYTTDLSKAEVYTREKALAQNKCRETDIPWPKSYIDEKTRPAVDMQYVDIQVALQDTGIVLAQPPKPEREIYKCEHCGRFVSEREYYSRVYHGEMCKKCKNEHDSVWHD